MTKDKKSVKAALKALLDENGRTPAEIEEARKTTARLMAKHELTEAEVLEDDPDLITLTTEVSRLGWIVSKAVSYYIAKVTGTLCTYQIVYNPLTGMRTDRKLQFFSGYRPDVEQASWLFGHIVERAMAGTKSYKGTRAKSDYLAAFGATVTHRLSALTRDVETVRDETGTALVVKKMAIIEDFVGEEGVLGKDRSRGHSITDYAAAAAGRRDGRTVGLHREVADGPLAIGRS